MNLKNSPASQLRSFTLSMPSYLGMKNKLDLEVSSAKSIIPSSRRSSGILSPSTSATTRPRIQSFDISLIQGFEDGQPRTQILPFMTPAKALDYLPFIYAQNGYEKTNELIKKSFGRKSDASLPLIRKESCLDMLAGIRESRAKNRPNKEILTHKNKSLDLS
ncbi:unnamed protein product [Blepharisma stoltei]|uniref:Uncharacterized protein n=1 Tax=Blepharisma stoltei TaxID=1481888 RepID=A0AAU9K6V7_9CILI|nr:unnamed protein product [Blepharisma stoltei]